VFGHRALCDLLDSQGFRVTADRGAEFVLLPTPLRLVDRMFNRAPSLASILVVTAESVEGPNKPRHLRAVTPLSIEEPESLEDEQEGPADPPRSSESSLGRLPRDPKVRSPWIVGTGLTLAGIAAFAVAVVLVEAFSDRDWRLSGMEWPTDFVTAALLVFLVPLVLFGLQLLLNVRTKLRDARASRV
jgi:hypothetical protein